MSRRAFFFLAAVLLGVDQLTKYWVVHRLGIYEPVTVIPGFFYLDRTENTGAAFSLLQHATLFLALIASVAVAGIIYYATKAKWPVNLFIGIGLALPLGGALGNFVDRVRLGYVVDFVELHFGSYIFPIFNVADSAICCGVALLVYSAMKTSAPVATKSEEENVL